MELKKKLLKKSHLYVIVDKVACGNRSLSCVVNACKGADIIQLRDKYSGKQDLLKQAFLLKKVLSGTKQLFIINEYLDIAKIVDSDGIHLGQRDTSIEIARQILGNHKIIGLSCHSIKQAQDAQDRGADYIGIGPIFTTATKPGYKPIGREVINKLKETISIPFFAIGGINLSNIDKIKSSVAGRVAVCQAVLQAKNIRSSITYFNFKLKNDPITIR